MCAKVDEGIGIGLDPGVIEVVRGLGAGGRLGIDAPRICPEVFDGPTGGIGADAARSLSALLSRDLLGLLMTGLEAKTQVLGL